MSKLEMCNKNYLSSWAQVGLLKWSIFGGNDRARFAYSWPIQNTFKMVWKNKILKSTMFENDLKCVIFLFLAFFTNFCPFKIGQSGNAFRPVASGFQKLAKLAFFDIFNENVNVDRFARNVE